jgi:hypothetical protein
MSKKSLPSIIDLGQLLLLLDHRSNRAIEHENPAPEQIVECLAH